ncbi:MAG: hypothetical protein Ct9H90mP22_5810 [Gammaproteobacteria bacterium]|nr:MAG: hypothetical protein Ct9H90mP22_5810 [Gammaproteobacteria bacterium]
MQTYSDFEKLVFKEIDKIPYGKTKSYKEIAIAIGKPKSFRAVANACGKILFRLNRPCHRVIFLKEKLAVIAQVGALDFKTNC